MAYCYIIIELNKMNIDEYLYEQKVTKGSFVIYKLSNFPTPCSLAYFLGFGF